MCGSLEYTYWKGEALGALYLVPEKAIMPLNHPVNIYWKKDRFFFLVEREHAILTQWLFI